MNAEKQEKFLSLVLRHKPEAIGIKLDKNGWADVKELIEKMPLTMDELNFLIRNSNKNRFSLNEDKSMIRANQGHSVQVDLELAESVPPEYLYHGTIPSAISSIMKKGLNKQKRHQVHLSVDRATALDVGQRRGKPVLLTIFAKKMYEDGAKFFLSANGVWLTDLVPAKYIKVS